MVHRSTGIGCLFEAFTGVQGATVLVDCPKTLIKLKQHLKAKAERLNLNQALRILEEADRQADGFPKPEVITDMLGQLEEMMQPSGNFANDFTELIIHHITFKSMPALIRAIAERPEVSGRYYGLVGHFHMDSARAPEPQLAVGAELHAIFRHACDDIELMADDDAETARQHRLLRKRWPICCSSIVSG
ncbi:unnamed protein product, partial [Mesorhabditis spiculigera]